MNTLRQHLPPLWTQRLDQARESVMQVWNEAPPWVRSPAALTGAVALAVIVMLSSLALVVQGVVERSEQLHEAQARAVITMPVASVQR